MIIHIKQKPFQCGQTCLAMLLNVEVDRICFLLNKYKGTTNKDIYRILNIYGVPYRYKRNRDPKKLPSKAIVKIGFKGSTATHFTLWADGYFHDPSEGVFRDYCEPDYIQFISYIEILECSK